MRRRRTGPSAGAERRRPRGQSPGGKPAWHPRWQELLSPLPRKKKVRVNLLGLGDVGATLLMGLRLLGGRCDLLHRHLRTCGKCSPAVGI